MVMGGWDEKKMIDDDDEKKPHLYFRPARPRPSPHQRAMKIVDKMKAATAEGKTFFSFEYFPPRTEEVREREREKGDGADWEESETRARLANRRCTRAAPGPAPSSPPLVTAIRASPAWGWSAPGPGPTLRAPAPNNKSADGRRRERAPRPFAFVPSPPATILSSFLRASPTSSSASTAWPPWALCSATSPGVRAARRRT